MDGSTSFMQYPVQRPAWWALEKLSARHGEFTGVEIGFELIFEAQVERGLRPNQLFG
jgi:hypothetical protein